MHTGERPTKSKRWTAPGTGTIFLHITWDKHVHPHDIQIYNEQAEHQASCSLSLAKLEPRSSRQGRILPPRDSQNLRMFTSGGISLTNHYHCYTLPEQWSSRFGEYSLKPLAIGDPSLAWHAWPFHIETINDILSTKPCRRRYSIKLLVTDQEQKTISSCGHNWMALYILGNMFDADA